MNTVNNQNRSRLLTAGLALLSITGLMASAIVTATPAQADPPRHAPAYGWRNKDDKYNRDDRKNDKKDKKFDKNYNGRDRNGNNDSRWSNNDRDRRDNDRDRRDRERIARERIARERIEHARLERERREREARSSRVDRDRDGVPDRYDRYPTDRRRH